MILTFALSHSRSPGIGVRIVIESPIQLGNSSTGPTVARIKTKELKTDECLTIEHLCKAFEGIQREHNLPPDDQNSVLSGLSKMCFRPATEDWATLDGSRAIFTFESGGTLITYTWAPGSLEESDEMRTLIVLMNSFHDKYTAEG